MHKKDNHLKYLWRLDPGSKLIIILINLGKKNKKFMSINSNKIKDK